MALFGNSSDGRSEPRSLVEFRAGKMSLSGTTVTADTRKGLIYMKQEGMDRLMHFYWKDRKSGEIVDDFILFPGEVEFKRVAQCTTGRVYLLKFRDRPDRKYFYWMQEPKASKDEELQKKVNDLINSPPDPSQSLGEGLGAGGLQALMGGHGASLQSLLASAHSNPQLLEQLLGSGALSPINPSMFEGISQSSSGGSSGSGRTGGSASTAGESRGRRSGTSQQTPSRPPQQQQQQQQQRAHQLQLDDLQNILSSMNIPPMSAQAPAEDRVSLTDVVTPDVLRPLSGDSAVQEQMGPHLPPTSESLEMVLTSPQFQQALGTFNSALQSGQLGPLMGQFGLGGPVVTAANTGDVNGFAEALEEELGGAKKGDDTSAAAGTSAGSTSGGGGSDQQPGETTSQQEKKKEDKEDAKKDDEPSKTN